MENDKIRTLSPLEAEVVLSLEWQERPTVSRAEIVKILGGSAHRADQVIRSLRSKNWLQRLSAGHYLLIPADRGPIGIPDANMLAIGRYFVEPYYYGYATAAAHYRFFVQSRATVWIVTTKQATERTFRTTTFRFACVVRRKFFGYEPVTVYGQQVNMSDHEKTLVDCADRPEFVGGLGELARIISRAAPKLDWEKFCAYTARIHSATLAQRFGYLADLAKVDVPRACRSGLQSLIKRNSRSYLGPPNVWGNAGRYDREWRVIVNVPKQEILSEI